MSEEQIDYWSKLKVNECWSEKQRYNLIMNLVLNSNPVGGITPPVMEEEEEDEVGSLSVTVKDEEDVAVQGCTVTLSDDEEEYTCTTGKQGGCNIPNIPVGEYTVSTSVEGYTDTELEDSFTITTGVNNITIILKDEDKL